MSSLADLRPGDAGFGPIHGAVGTLVGAGELAVAPFDHMSSWRQWRRVRHCGWILGEASPGFGHGARTARGPLFAQAMPSGFEIIELGPEHWTGEWTYLRPNYRPGQADLMAGVGRRMARKHIRYGFEDYAAIAAHRLHIRPRGLDDFIARLDPDGDPYRAICSQALDSALSVTGGLINGKVFDDGRLPQDVTPSEVYLKILAIGCEHVFRPGVS